MRKTLGGWRILGLVCWIFLSASNLPAQTSSPDANTQSGHVVSSSYFGFSYTVPDGLEENTGDLKFQMLQHRVPAGDKWGWLLFSARDPLVAARQGGVRVMAHKKPVDAPPSPSATAQTYEESLVPRLNEQGWTLANGVQKVQIDNQDFFRSDYDRASAHLTVVCIVLKDYILEFTLSADSLEEIESLRRSLSTISFGPVTVH